MALMSLRPHNFFLETLSLPFVEKVTQIFPVSFPTSLVIPLAICFLLSLVLVMNGYARLPPPFPSLPSSVIVTPFCFF